MGEGLFQPFHLLLILGVALLLFGPQKLPQLGKGLGEAIRGFREGLHSAEKKAIEPAPEAKDAASAPKSET
jgi:sec-independent protein translocase protein TatA